MPVNHSITAFDQVKLPFAALLGEIDTTFTHHQLFLISIWRVAVGTLSLAMITVPAMKIASTIAYRYSCRREVGIEGARQSILSFRTQQLPVFYAVATVGVLEAFAKWAAPVFSDSGLDMRVRHAIATCAKAVLVSSHQSMNLLLSDRCGAQGLFDHNQITGFHVNFIPIIYSRLTFSLQSEVRGMSIAEGDILALCIRTFLHYVHSTSIYSSPGLASEILMNRYDVPATSNPTSLLARHEAGLLTEFRALCQLNGGNRSQYFANHILPQCVPIIEAIGHRLAYDAATAAGQPDEMLALYECAMVKQDLAWYIENSVLTRAEFRQMEDQAILGAQPHIASWVDGFDVDQFITSPIVTATAWRSFVESLPTFTSTSRPISLARL
jgi:acyl-CoA oxidase